MDWLNSVGRGRQTRQETKFLTGVTPPSAPPLPPLLLIPAPEVWAWKEKPDGFEAPCSSTFMSGLFLVINWLFSILGDISLEKFLSLEAKLENQFPWVLSRAVAAGRERRSRIIFPSWGGCCSLVFTWFVAQSLTQQGFYSVQWLSAEAEITTRV